MNSTATADSRPTALPNQPAENTRHLPAGARAAYADFQAGGDPAALGVVILALLHDFSPRRSSIPLAGLPGGTRLVDDLGFDSLAITEVVFAAEDLFRISITNEEIAQVRTLDDLRDFIHVKVAGRPVR